MTLMMPGTNAPDPMLERTPDLLSAGKPMGVPTGGVASLLPFIQKVLAQNVMESRGEEVDAVMSQIQQALQPFMGDNASPTPTAPIGGGMPAPPTASATGALGTTATMARPTYFPMDEDGDGIDQFGNEMIDFGPGAVNPQLDFLKGVTSPGMSSIVPAPQPAAPAMQIPGIAGLAAVFGR
jgi:hypothetical protein